MNNLILTPKEQKEQGEIREYGRVIAQGMRTEKVQHEKNMAKAEKRNNTMLEKAATQALSGGVRR